MNTIHWIGAGLSAGPGIQRLAQTTYPLTLWNRTIEKADQVISGFEREGLKTKSFNLASFEKSLGAEDIVVSMLPAPMHPEIAKICLKKQAHFVSTSYLSDAMKSMDSDAKTLGLTFLNEVGLDPGIDHLMAHHLVAQWKNSSAFDPSAELYFRSYCGGFPKVPNEFKYKFSWSPVGVLRALKTPASYVDSGKAISTSTPWKNLWNFEIEGETFEVYPNRNSLPYQQEYHFDPQWNIQHFCRGTLRLKGWSDAWTSASVFDTVEHSPIEELEILSDKLWEKYRYQENELDRVVLFVEIEAKKKETTLWKSSHFLDESGPPSHSAMAKLVSLPATLGVEMIIEGRAKPGVQGAPEDPIEIERWFSALGLK